MALAGAQQLGSREPVSVHAHFTEGVARPEGRRGANGVVGENDDADEGGDERTNTRRERGRKRGQ